MFEFGEATLEDAISAALHVWDDSRSAYLSRDVPERAREAITELERLAAGVVLGTEDLAVPESLQDVYGSGSTPSHLLSELDEHGAIWRRTVLDGIQIRLAFAHATDVEGWAERALELSEFLLRDRPSEATVRFIRRLARCYVVGCFPECVVMCRAILETALVDRFQQDGTSPPSSLKSQIDTAAQNGWLSPDSKAGAHAVRTRGNKAVHHDPLVTTDVLGTIRSTVEVLRELGG